MKALLRDLNDPTKFKIEDIEGHIPENLVTLEVPPGVDASDADCLDLEASQDAQGFERIRAVINQSRKAAKDLAKSQAETARENAKQAREAAKQKAKDARARGGAVDWSKVKNADLINIVKDLAERVASLEE